MSEGEGEGDGLDGGVPWMSMPRHRPDPEGEGGFEGRVN